MSKEEKRESSSPASNPMGLGFDPSHLLGVHSLAAASGLPFHPAMNPLSNPYSLLTQPPGFPGLFGGLGGIPNPLHAAALSHSLAAASFYGLPNHPNELGSPPAPSSSSSQKRGKPPRAGSLSSSSSSSSRHTPSTSSLPTYLGGWPMNGSAFPFPPTDSLPSSKHSHSSLSPSSKTAFKSSSSKTKTPQSSASLTIPSRSSSQSSHSSQSDSKSGREKSSHNPLTMTTDPFTGLDPRSMISPYHMSPELAYLSQSLFLHRPDLALGNPLLPTSPMLAAAAGSSLGLEPGQLMTSSSSKASRTSPAQSPSPRSDRKRTSSESERKRERSETPSRKNYLNGLKTSESDRDTSSSSTNSKLTNNSLESDYSNLSPLDKHELLKSSFDPNALSHYMDGDRKKRIAESIRRHMGKQDIASLLAKHEIPSADWLPSHMLSDSYSSEAEEELKSMRKRSLSESKSSQEMNKKHKSTEEELSDKIRLEAELQKQQEQLEELRKRYSLTEQSGMDDSSYSSSSMKQQDKLPPSTSVSPARQTDNDQRSASESEGSPQQEDNKHEADISGDDGSPSKKKHMQLREQDLFIPLEHGWNRQTIINGMGRRGIVGDVYYFAPCGKKMKTIPDVMRYLERNPNPDLGRENFTFNTKANVGQFFEVRGGQSTPVPMTETEILERIELSRGKRARMQMLARKKREKAVREQALARQIMENKLKRRMEFQSTSMVEKKKEKERQKLLKHQEKVRAQEQIRRERELRAQQIIEARNRRQHELEELRLADIAKRNKEREMKRQQLILMKEQERERRRQHLVLIKALEQKKKQEEKQNKERLREEKLIEKIKQRELRMQQRKVEIEVAMELKKPAEDMELKNHKPLPTYPRLKTKLAGKAVADCLMVVEFLTNFGHALNLDKSSIPTLATLERGLLSTSDEDVDQIMSLVMILLRFAIDDVGVPNPKEAVTKLNQKITDIEMTDSTMCELLRIFIRSRGEGQMSEWLNEKPLEALNPTKQAAILAFLCNELLSSKVITSEIDKHMESINTLRRDKWIVEGQLRQLRVFQARKFNKLPRTADRKAPTLNNEESSSLAKLTSDDEDEKEEDEDDGSGNESDGAISIMEIISNSSSNMPFEPVDESMTREESDKKIESLRKAHLMYRQKVFHASLRLRSVNVGQDRFKRTYWILPLTGGIYVEGMESGEPEEYIKENTKPEVTETKLEEADTKPEVAETKSKVTDSKPEVTMTKPEVADTNLEVKMIKPEAKMTKPEEKDTKPEVNEEENEIKLESTEKEKVKEGERTKLKDEFILSEENGKSIESNVKLEMTYRSKKTNQENLEKIKYAENYYDKLLDDSKTVSNMNGIKDSDTSMDSSGLEGSSKISEMIRKPLPSDISEVTNDSLVLADSNSVDVSSVFDSSSALDEESNMESSRIDENDFDENEEIECIDDCNVEDENHLSVTTRENSVSGQELKTDKITKTVKVNLDSDKFCIDLNKLSEDNFTSPISINCQPENISTHISPRSDTIKDTFLNTNENKFVSNSLNSVDSSISLEKDILRNSYDHSHTSLDLKGNVEKSDVTKELHLELKSPTEINRKLNSLSPSKSPGNSSVICSLLKEPSQLFLSKNKPNSEHQFDSYVKDFSLSSSDILRIPKVAIKKDALPLKNHSNSDNEEPISSSLLFSSIPKLSKKKVDEPVGVTSKLKQDNKRDLDTNSPVPAHSKPVNQSLPPFHPSAQAKPLDLTPPAAHTNSVSKPPIFPVVSQSLRPHSHQPPFIPGVTNHLGSTNMSKTSLSSIISPPPAHSHPAVSTSPLLTSGSTNKPLLTAHSHIDLALMKDADYNSSVLLNEARKSNDKSKSHNLVGLNTTSSSDLQSIKSSSVEKTKTVLDESWFSLIPRTPCDELTLSRAVHSTTPSTPYKSSLPVFTTSNLSSSLALTSSVMPSITSMSNFEQLLPLLQANPSFMSQDALPSSIQLLLQSSSAHQGSEFKVPHPPLDVPLNYDPWEVFRAAQGEAKPIPKGKQHGWWRIHDLEVFRSIMPLTLTRGIRESHLQRGVHRYKEFAKNHCSFDSSKGETNPNSVNEEKSSPNKTRNEIKSETKEEKEKKESDFSDSEDFKHKKLLTGEDTGGVVKTEIDPVDQEEDMDYIQPDNDDEWSVKTMHAIETAALEEVEALEERIFHASLQAKQGWKPKKDESLQIVDRSVTEVSDDQSYPLDLAISRLLELEANIERRYLKPPLIRSCSMSLHNLSTDNDDDEDVPPGLLLWRQAVVGSENPAQLSLCTQMLAKSICWEKSIMKVTCMLCRKDDNEAELLLCDGCDKGYHTYCFKPKMEDIPDGDWFCFECVSKASGTPHCVVCGNKSAKIVSCSKCPRNIHLDCLDPPLTRMPKRWQCINCVDEKDTPKRSKKKKESPPTIQRITIPKLIIKEEPADPANPCTTSTGTPQYTCVEKPPVADVTKYMLSTPQYTAGLKPEADIAKTESKTATPPKTIPEKKKRKKKEKDESEAPKKKEKKEKEKTPKKERKTKKKVNKNEEEESKEVGVNEDKNSKETHKDLVFCGKILTELEKHEEGWPFLKPVNLKQFPTYKKYIKAPMDFTTIKNKIKSKEYQTKEDFSTDISLVFDNCETFNEDESEVGQAGHHLRQFFQTRWNQIFPETTR